jgi:putative phage-type endonuclease
MPELVDVVPGSGEWLAARRAGVTATDIVTILGLSTHDSVYSLFWRKLGQVPDEPDRDRWALGRHMEPYIAQKWEDANGFGAMCGGLYRSDDRAWQLATPDCLFVESDQRASYSPLECKSWADADRKSWEGGPPPAVRAQLLWQMDVLDARRGYWAVVFLPSGRFDHGVLEHGITDKHLSADRCNWCTDVNLMREAGEEFYRRLTFVLPPPDPDSSAATLAALRARFTRTEGKQAEVDGTLYQCWVDERNAATRHDELARIFEIQLREQAGEAQILTVDGEIVARRIVVDAQVKAHTRHQDYYRRIKTKDEDE